MAIKSSSNQEHWTNQIRKAAERVAIGKVYLTQQASRLQVYAPDSDDWIAKATRLGGRYRRRTGMWSFPGYMRSGVIELLKQCFGEECIK